MEISFCDLRSKEVINICDGKKLGNIIDMVFDSFTCKITGIVVPGEKTFFSFFKSNPAIFIPFCKIRKIGKDVILVELNPINTTQVNTLENKNETITTQSNEGVEEIEADLNEQNNK
ncbi:MAG: YlmC/YmxH family sporulation protein [Clostridia bacterium]|nr:YlmC/YmxH family sporulation protein [Clostridia bacterium]